MTSRKKELILTGLFLLTLASLTYGQHLPSARPETEGMSGKHLSLLDSIIQDAIKKKNFPGAVVVVLRQGKVVYRKAFGSSQLIPIQEPMRTEMIFDLASITKPVATATSIMLLVEQGKIRLWDKVKDFVPEWVPYIKEKGMPGEDARLYHLLTHTSGLQPYAEVKEVEKLFGRPCSTDNLVKYIAVLPKNCQPGKEFIYSCLNFITLAYIVEKVTGQSIADFAVENIFKPLGMKHTFYNPPESLRVLCVPTEIVNGELLRGIVHDPLARLQGGVSGNAGLFSTADDLAIFAWMLLNDGRINNVRIMSPLTVDRVTEIYPNLPESGRGLGWDLSSSYATVKGDLFGSKSYGHSGYTGTSIWLDPETKTSVIFLTNRVHPDDKGEIISIRSKVSNVVAASILKK